MTEYAPTSAGIESGWESQTHGPSPWITTPDEAASYLEGTAFFLFWATWDDLPAIDALTFDVQARVDGYAVLRASKTYEGTGGVTAGVSYDMQIGTSEFVGVEQPWQRGTYSTNLAHAGGPLTMWFRTTNLGGLWTGDYSYVGIVTDEGIFRAPRRIFPRDDGLTGGARRTWPPSKGHQWGNRVDGSGYL